MNIKEQRPTGRKSLEGREGGTAAAIDYDKVSVEIVTRCEDLPDIPGGDFFHSRELFRISGMTKGQTPYMVMARHGESVLAHLLVTLRRRGSWFPPYLFTQGRAYGCGDYAEGVDQERIFGLMLTAITRFLRNKLCFYIEFSDLRSKMFGYGKFRDNGFFPVLWTEVHNSLHSKAPEEWLGKKAMKRIKEAEKAGVTAALVEGEDEFRHFYSLFKQHFTLKIRRYLPKEDFFRELGRSGNCRLLATRHKGRIIGGCIVAYSGNNAYLWYLASRRKSRMHLHPETMTIWAAIRQAYEEGMWHIYFMDVGLPLKRDRLRRFILGFGGRPVGTYRWFHFYLPWVNRILNWIYCD